MNERLLQFIWQHLYFAKEHLFTVKGQPVIILSQGVLNTNQGPDFLQARLSIDHVLWAGNIELHLRTSDWDRHGHTGNEHYNNIILHVVWEHDLHEEQPLPVLELKNRVASSLLNRYYELMQQKSFIPCSELASTVPEIIWSNWKERMIAERLFEKNEKINRLLNATNYHWEETFWQMLARNFGITVNADAFEAMACSIPVNLLAKHKNQIHQLEALLFGQLGLLNSEFKEDYPQLLKKEYQFLQKKHKLQQPSCLISYLRMRPSNFPTVRLAQLAMLIHQSHHLFSKVLEAENLQNVQKLFSVTANDYWHYHYQFDEKAAFRKKQTGMGMIDNILINTVIPVLFAYAEYHNKEQLKQKALLWLQQLPKENNNITSKWEQAGIEHTNAFDSQALLHLKRHYCDDKFCLNCAVGNKLVKNNRL